MTTLAPDRLLTAEEFEALPEDPSVGRTLIRGVLWEKSEMTIRSKRHTTAMVRLCRWLDQWADTSPPPRPVVVAVETGCWLRRQPASRVGIDVDVFSADVAALDQDDQKLFAGPPMLAVEILSPSDQQSEAQATIDEYLAAGVKLVWIVDTHFQTVIVHRPDGKPELFTTGETLSGDPHLPGLAIPVEQLFPR